MTKLTRILAKVTYAIMGAAYLTAGALVLLVNTGLLPDAVREFLVARAAQNNLVFLHVLQELGALLVFVALVTFWCVRNYEQSRALHWMLTLYWAIMAVIHWFHVASPTVSVLGGLINTIPLALFLALGLMRAAERRPEGAAEARHPSAVHAEPAQHV